MSIIIRLLFNFKSNMERLAPEDVQAIIAGVASNRQFIQGIAEQVKEAIQLPTPSSANSSPSEEGVQQSGSQPGQQQSPLPTQGWSRDKQVIKKFHRTYRMYIISNGLPPPHLSVMYTPPLGRE